MDEHGLGEDGVRRGVGEGQGLGGAGMHGHRRMSGQPGPGPLGEDRLRLHAEHGPGRADRIGQVGQQRAGTAAPDGRKPAIWTGIDPDSLRNGMPGLLPATWASPVAGRTYSPSHRAS